MSWLSKALGLDKHPDTLAAINAIGHSLAADALSSITAEEINARLGAVIDKTVGPILDKLPIPAQEAGVAKWYLGNLLKTGIEAELKAFEVAAPAPAPTGFITPGGSFTPAPENIL